MFKTVFNQSKMVSVRSIGMWHVAFGTFLAPSLELFKYHNNVELELEPQNNRVVGSEMCNSKTTANLNSICF